MIMKANKQIGFIYKDNESIDKILKDGDVVFERGFLREKTSTTLPITFGGVGKDLKDYKVYSNTVQKILPDGYTQVDYIESSGTQYIDTDFKPNQDTIVEFKSIMTQVGSSYGFYGAREGTSSPDSYVLLASRYYDNNTSYQFNYGGGGGVIDLNIPNTNINKYLGNKNELYINDNLQITRPIATFSTNYNLYLMAVNTANTPTLHAYGRLYYFKIYDNNVLVRDFIPCYRNSDNEVGLYDLVNKVFYTNQGTGVFTYGSVAPTPDAPIEMVSCGDRTNNLFDKANATYKNGYYKNDNGVEQSTQTSGYLTSYIQVKPNTIYTIQGSLKQTNQSSQSYAIYYYNINKQWISRTVITNNPPYTFTTPNDCYFIQFQYRQEVYDENTIQIEEGSTATSYEPYGYKIPINVRSDNLFDKDSTTKNEFLDSNGDIVERIDNVWYLSDYIPVNPNKNYTYQGLTFVGAAPYSAYYDINKNLISTFKQAVGQNTILIPNNAYYVRFSIINRSQNQDLPSFMIEEGSTVPDKYIPYYNETTNIYLDEPLRKTKDGTYVDYIDFANKKIYRKLGETGLTDFSAFTVNSVLTNYVQYVTNVISNLKLSINDNSLLYCNYIKTFSGTTATSKIRINISNEYLGTTSSSTSQEAKQALINLMSGKTMEFVYPLETPTEESITLPNIPTIDGNNTLNIETEITPSQVYIKYKSNT